MWNNFNLESLKLISSKDITFMSDIPKTLLVDKSGEFKLLANLNFEPKWTREFLTSLKSESLYTLTPFWSVTGNKDEPYFILSKQLLVTKYSDPTKVNKFLASKLVNTIEQFGITNRIEIYHLIFKYKEIKVLDNKFF